MPRRFRPLLAVTVAVLSAACSATRAHPTPPSRTLVECASGFVETPEQATTFANCSIVTGDLVVEGSHLADLQAFSKLTRVEGSLVIADNPNLEDLRGLERLGSVGRLEIRNNPELASLSHLKSLGTAGRVSVLENPKLRSLVGLGRLEQLEELELRENGLYDTRGLEKLQVIGELVVERNRTLISLGGLANVRRAGDVQIHENPRLCGGLGLLPRLERVERELSVARNSGLTKSEILALHARVRQDGTLPPGDGEIALTER